jgi:hypothetical protein
MHGLAGAVWWCPGTAKLTTEFLVRRDLFNRYNWLSGESTFSPQGGGNRGAEPFLRL